MKKKYLFIAIFYSFIVILFASLKACASENIYTISGNYSYSEVLNALSERTKRSVLGSTECLNLRRDFDIYEKRFSIAVDHVNKNLFTDGYILTYDSTCFYVKKLSANDTLSDKNKEPEYQIYMPYSRRYLVTKNKQEYLNALQKDKENYQRDSIININSGKVYRIDIELLGFTNEKSYKKGIDIDDGISVNISKDILNAVLNMNMGLTYNNYKINDDYNFYRNIVTYVNGDTTEMLFGSEERRLNTKITNDKVITDQYESIYNGITIKIKGNNYELMYRNNDNQIKMPGYIDSVSYCQYKLTNDNKKTRYRYVNMVNKTSSVMYIYIRVKKQELDKRGNYFVK